MNEEIDDDKPIWGGKNIGREIGKGERATFHLLESGQLDPAVSKVGNQWVTTKRRLRERLFGKPSELA